MEESRNELEEQMKKEVEKRVEEGVTKWITILIQVGIAFAISVVVFKFVWAWVVPDLFPGAVTQGLISANLSWLSALKLAVLVGVLSGFYDSLIETAKRRQ
jgi:hypothetical protein